MHIDDFQRQANHTAHRYQQQGGNAKTAMLFNTLRRQNDVAAFRTFIIAYSGGLLRR